MLAAALALTLSFAPPDASPATEASSVDATVTGTGATDPDADEPEPSAPEPTPAAAPSRVILAPTQPGDYQLLDGQGQALGGPRALGDGAQIELELSPGTYAVQGPDGVSELEIGSAQALAWDGVELMPSEVWATKRLQVAEAEARAREAEAQAFLATTEAAGDVAARSSARGNWRVWASPLASTLIPGVGQFINGQGGKGTGLLFGAIGSTAAAAALYSLNNDGSRAAGAEYARLIGYGVFSTAAPILWVYGIADAYRVAAKKEVAPNLDHQVRLSVTRMMTVGFRADEARPGFFDDWSVAIMGQATRRLTVGISDLSVKAGGRQGPQVWQFGARLDYRVFDRRKVWIDLGLGSLFQVASAQLARDLDPNASLPGGRTTFSAAPYGQLDVRIFVLDRLSLDLSPRLTVPLGTRHYSASRALPRYAPELELGAGVSTYF